MKRELTIIPKLKVHPNKCILYNEIHWSPSKPNKTPLMTSADDNYDKIKHIINSKRTANGELSKIASKKLSTAIDYLLLIASKKTVLDPYSGKHIRFRAAFITLTLSSKQKHSDNEIKSKLLDSLLIELGKKFKVVNYVWRAEKQQNGNIHFHILTDKFIAWSQLRDIWNRLQNKLGYVDEYRKNLHEYHKNGFRLNTKLLNTWSESKQRQAYSTGLKTDFHNPNSIDIHSLKKIKNVKDYIKKYCIKNQKDKQGNKIETPEHLKVLGRLWGCNYKLTGIKGLDIEIDNELTEIIETFKELKQIKQFSSDYFTVFYLNVEDLNNSYTQGLFNRFIRYLSETFDLPMNYQFNFAA